MTWERPSAACGVTFGRLDFDHIRAEVGERFGTGGPGYTAAVLDYGKFR